MVTATVVGVPKRVKRFRMGGTDLQLGDLAVDITRHDAFAQQLEATHFGIDKAAPMIPAPLLPNVASKPARGR